MSRKRFIILVLLCAIPAGLAVRGYVNSLNDEVDLELSEGWEALKANRPDVALELVRLMSTDDINEAEQIELALIAGEAYGKLGQFDAAIEAYKTVPVSNSNTSLAARVASADIWLQTGQLTDCVTEFELAHQHHPESRLVMARLALVYGIAGFRERGWPILIQLLQTGPISRQELALIGDARTGYSIPGQFLEDRATNDPFLVHGLARFHIWQRSFEEAEQYLTRLESLGTMPVEAAIARGLFLYERDGRTALADWLTTIPEGIERSGEYWYLRGQHTASSSNSLSTLRCYFESLKRWPDYLPAVSAIAKVAATSGHTELAETAASRSRELQRLATASATLDRYPSMCYLIQDAAEATAALGRPLESAAWRRIEQSTPSCRSTAPAAPTAPTAPIPPAAPTEANSDEGLVMRQWVEPKRLLTDRFDFDQFPLPSNPSSLQPRDEPVASEPLRLAFRNDASAVGLDFRLYRPAEVATAMYSFNGAGAGAIDFDRDLDPDLYLVQNSDFDPTIGQGVGTAARDELFRNNQANGFEAVSIQAGVGSHAFGQGIAVGDFDQDGFPDFYLGNIGPNELYLNNGDGTFRNVSNDLNYDHELARRWSTSVAMADFDGDGATDLFDANYLTGESVYTRTCDSEGRPRSCSPRAFQSCPDALWNGTGQLELGATTTFAGPDEEKPANGLGVIVAQFDGSPGLDVFVANDLTPNHLFIHSQPSSGRFIDDAILRGLGYNAEGEVQACMGIAADDINADGTTDLFVTNFYRERNTLYLSEPDGAFTDVVRDFRLAETSLNKLGFGSQFSDIDRDGDADLLCLNGHIDDQRTENIPYYMSHSLYQRVGSVFEEVSTNVSGEYFDGEYLGRALTRLDWDQDGRTDFVATDLEFPVALLTNSTDPVGHVVRFSLQAVKSQRDAIGAIVTVTADNFKKRQELLCGDGYLASNERVLDFAVPNNLSYVNVNIDWPSGAQDSWNQIPVQSWSTLVESHAPRQLPIQFQSK